MGQERYEPDATGLESSKRLVESRGYKILQVIKSQRRHHVLDVENSQGERRFVKASTDPAEYIFLENQVRVDEFLRPLTKGLKIRIPLGDYSATKEGAIADFEFVEGEPFATESGLRTPFTQEDLEALFQFLLRKHALKQNDVPEFFLKRAAAEFADAQMVAKLEWTYLAPAIGKMITEDEARRIKDLFVATGFKREFEHHDLVAWNMLCDPQGKIVLTDPEHARWGMKWYDLAYNYLQTRVLLGEPEQAKRQLAFFLKRFKEVLPNEDIEQEIFHPLAYWLGAECYLASLNQELKPLVRELMPAVLNRDIQSLID